MKANELRLGNWVDFNGEKARISQLWEMEAIFKCGDSALYSELNPIPITEEILLKAGLSKEREDNKYGRVFLVSNTKYIIRIVNYGNPQKVDFGYSLEISDDKDWCGIKRIYFIHDLQNTIFALTGEEIKIDLE